MHAVEPARARPPHARLGRTTERSESDRFGQKLYRRPRPTAGSSTAVARIAAERGVPRAQVALAWMLHKPAVTAPIVGATKPEHVADAVAAVDLRSTTTNSPARGALRAARARGLLAG